MLLDFFFKPRQQQKLPFVTDMHSHIVPGVDDGSPDMESSVELLSHMADWGLERVFTSPHSTEDNYENTPQSLAEPFACLRKATENIPVALDYHLEYRIDDFFLTQLEADNIRTLPGKFLLIENGFSHEPWGLESIVNELLNKGYNPVLAHPERYSYYAKRHRDRYTQLHNMGLYFQVNLLSLAGHYGKLQRQAALYLLENRMVQFVGTDLHRPTQLKTIEDYLSSKAFIKDIKLFSNLHNDAL